MRRIARLLSYGGSVAIVFALSVYHARYISVPVYDFTNSTRFSWAIAYTVLLEITAYAFGMPDQPRSTRQAAWLASLAVGISVVAISMAQLVLGDIFLPRFVIFGSAVLIVPWQVLLNAFSRSTTTRHQNRDRILFVGKESEEARLAHDLTQSPEKAATFVGGLTPDAAAEGDPHAERSPLAMALERTQATVLVLDRSAQDDERVVGQVAELHELGIRIRTLQGAYEEWLGKLPLSELERASLLFDIGEIHGIHYGQLKRMMDLTLGMLGAVVLVLITPFVLIGNLLANRGPIAYRQPRVGKGGETFTILKFRTMTNSPKRDVAPEDPDAPTTTWTQQDDPRVTPFGKLLRASHLDELPQVINILKGDLSIVGPRPEQPHYVEELSQKLPFYDLRHLVRPGLTGWAQVKYGYAGDEDDALEKLQYEFFYLRNQSLGFDNRIIVRTIRAMIGGQGRGR